MEFTLMTDLSALPKQLECNFDEVRSWLAARLEKYDNLIVTQEDLPVAKADVASLRKFVKALDGERIAIKKAYMAPYEALEQRVNELKAMCERPIQAIDTQVKAFDERRKQDKKEALQTYFAQVSGMAGEYISFEDVFDPKWLNATVSEDKAKEMIDEIAKRYNDEIEALESICKGCSAVERFAIREYYRQTRSMAGAVEYKRQMEAHKDTNGVAKEEAISYGVKLTDEISESTTDRATSQKSCFEKESIEICLRVRGTLEQIQQLKQFLIANKIAFEKA